MSIFTIGDLHLSKNSNKPMDVFRGWADYEKKIEENWEYMVSEEDTVIVCGDITWGKNLEEAKEDFLFLDGLKGKKIILKGNHDYYFETKTKVEKFFAENDIKTISVLHNNSYIVENINICGTRGWVDEKDIPHDTKMVNREANRLELSIEARDKNLETIVFLHYPPVFSKYVCEEIMAVLLKYDIKECYFGHIHGAKMKYCVNEYKGIKMHLISADNVEFTPVLVK